MSSYILKIHFSFKEQKMWIKDKKSLILCVAETIMLTKCFIFFERSRMTLQKCFNTVLKDLKILYSKPIQELQIIYS